jgi:catechol 2,3-dioxygenase-like lactoylglutathione lyase family enzyme
MKVDHVNVRCTDPDAACAFFEATVGLSPEVVDHVAFCFDDPGLQLAYLPPDIQLGV